MTPHDTLGQVTKDAKKLGKRDEDHVIVEIIRIARADGQFKIIQGVADIERP